MIDHKSRYHTVGDAVYAAPDGRQIKYKKRRFLPQGEQLDLYGEETTQVGDRPDTVAARTLGDPLQYWQLCDANNVMNPFALIGDAGARVRIPAPYFQDLG